MRIVVVVVVVVALTYCILVPPLYILFQISQAVTFPFPSMDVFPNDYRLCWGLPLYLCCRCLIELYQ
jgi:hypothetical protein